MGWIERALPSRRSRVLERGTRVALVLQQAWRSFPRAWRVSLSELTEITPLLLRGGTGSLVWWRLRNSELRSSPPALLLQQAYRFSSLLDAAREKELPCIVSRIRSSGVEPILAKGWAAARLYPEPDLRPYGDIDLYVPAEQHHLALSSLRSLDQAPAPVDLHRGFRDLEDRAANDLYARSREIDLEGTKIRVFGPEDHLRLFCLHLLRHGASRPLWLCDVGAALESRPGDFDWEYFFAGDRTRSKYVAATLLLAHRLLGARIDDTPVEQHVCNLPPWLVPAVLTEWGRGFTRRAPMRGFLSSTAGLFQELRRHWPNPIEASARTGAPLNGLPRLPFQIANGFIRTVRFVRSQRSRSCRA